MVAQLPPGARVVKRIAAVLRWIRADVAICTQPSPLSVFGRVVDADTLPSWTTSSLEVPSPPPDFTHARTVHQPGRRPLSRCEVAAVKSVAAQWLSLPLPM